ncbi:hypothetical protein GGI06_006725, partial [Coemansia sp. S85]
AQGRAHGRRGQAVRAGGRAVGAGGRGGAGRHAERRPDAVQRRQRARRQGAGRLAGAEPRGARHGVPVGARDQRAARDVRARGGVRVRSRRGADRDQRHRPAAQRRRPAGVHARRGGADGRGHCGAARGRRGRCRVRLGRRRPGHPLHEPLRDGGRALPQQVRAAPRVPRAGRDAAGSARRADARGDGVLRRAAHGGDRRRPRHRRAPVERAGARGPRAPGVCQPRERQPAGDGGAAGRDGQRAGRRRARRGRRRQRRQGADEGRAAGAGRVRDGDGAGARRARGGRGHGRRRAARHPGVCAGAGGLCAHAGRQRRRRQHGA